MISKTSPPDSPRLLDRVRREVRYRHYALSTEKAYVYWVKFFVKFQGLRHPREMGVAEVEAFLSHLANERQVSPSTHRQALAALLFLYGAVLKVDLPWLQEIGRPKSVQRLPVVLTVDEVRRTLAAMDGTARLIAQLLYGTGMRIMEAMRLRVKDVEFERSVIIVREAKGGKDRVVMLPDSLREALTLQMEQAKTLWELDRADQIAGVEMPFASYWVFPQATRSPDPGTSITRRHHFYNDTFRRAFARAMKHAGVLKPASPNSLRHSFDTHVAKIGAGVRSPMDALASMPTSVRASKAVLLALNEMPA